MKNNAPMSLAWFSLVIASEAWRSSRKLATVLLATLIFSSSLSALWKPSFRALFAPSAQSKKYAIGAGVSTGACAVGIVVAAVIRNRAITKLTEAEKNPESVTPEQIAQWKKQRDRATKALWVLSAFCVGSLFATTAGTTQAIRYKRDLPLKSARLLMNDANGEITHLSADVERNYAKVAQELIGSPNCPPNLKKDFIERLRGLTVRKVLPAEASSTREEEGGDGASDDSSALKAAKGVISQGFFQKSLADILKMPDVVKLSAAIKKGDELSKSQKYYAAALYLRMGARGAGAEMGLLSDDDMLRCQSIFLRASTIPQFVRDQQDALPPRALSFDDVDTPSVVTVSPLPETSQVPHMPTPSSPADERGTLAQLLARASIGTSSLLDKLTGGKPLDESEINLIRGVGLYVADKAHESEVNGLLTGQCTQLNILRRAYKILDALPRVSVAPPLVPLPAHVPAPVVSGGGSGGGYVAPYGSLATDIDDNIIALLGNDSELGQEFAQHGTFCEQELRPGFSNAVRELQGYARSIVNLQRLYAQAVAAHGNGSDPALRAYVPMDNCLRRLQEIYFSMNAEDQGTLQALIAAHRE